MYVYRPVKKYWTPSEAIRVGQRFGSHRRAGMAGQVLPNVPPYWIDGVIVLDCRHKRWRCPLLLKMSARVVMSISPVFRNPYSAGSAPTTRPRLPIQLASRMLPKPVGPSGNYHAIDAELQIGVVVADMEEAAGRGVLRDAGELQQDSLDRGVVAAGKGVDRFMGESG